MVLNPGYTSESPGEPERLPVPWLLPPGDSEPEYDADIGIFRGFPGDSNMKPGLRTTAPKAK